MGEEKVRYRRSRYRYVRVREFVAAICPCFRLRCRLRPEG